MFGLSLRRKPRPGVVRINQVEYLRLLESDRYVQRLAHENATLRAELIAREALGRTDLEGQRSLAYLLANVPLTVDGDLHEVAFRALVDREVWRLHELSIFGPHVSRT